MKALTKIILSFCALLSLEAIVHFKHLPIPTDSTPNPPSTIRHPHSIQKNTQRTPTTPKPPQNPAYPLFSPINDSMCDIAVNPRDRKTCSHRLRIDLTTHQKDTIKVLNTALHNVETMWHSWPGFDYSEKSPIKISSFTLCLWTPNNVQQKSNIQQLCSAQLQGMQLWGSRNQILYKQVTHPDNTLDSTRAPQWQKIAYMHAFLKLPRFDYVFFLDADCMVADVHWDPLKFIHSHLPNTSSKEVLFVDDTLDYHSTGEMLAHRSSHSLQLFRDWYSVSALFFNLPIPVNTLRQPDPHSFDSNPVQFVTDNKIPVINRCHARDVFHEQGCTSQFYSALPHHLSRVHIFNANRLRRVFFDGPYRRQNPLIHACCRSRQEEASILLRCLKDMQSPLGKC